MSAGSGNLALVQRLEALAFRAWPALHTEAPAGWLQRFSGGYTQRANSINGLDPEAPITTAIIDALEAPYPARGLPPIWRITPLAPPATDGLLAARGYPRDRETVVQVAPLDGRLDIDPEVRIAPAPSARWLAGFADLQPVRVAHRSTMARMLESIAAPVGFAHIEEPAGPVAFGLGVVDGDHLGVFDMLVAPTARRRGLARRVLASLSAWGHALGARTAYLQVVAGNTAARALYADHGFETVYGYWYRSPPPP